MSSPRLGDTAISPPRNKSNKIDFEGPNSQNKGNKFFNLLDKVNGLSKNERITVLENSENQVKFLHVRNPFDRLYSAWHQKFNTSFPNKSQYKYYVNKMDIEHKIPDGMLCSFADFVKYFLEHPNSNFHWRNIFWQCQPCQIDYEFISKQESFQEDSDFIVREIYGKDASFKVEKAYTDSSKSVKKQVYSELAWLPDDLHKQLEKHFYWEMLVLGYTYPEY